MSISERTRKEVSDILYDWACEFIDDDEALKDIEPYGLRFNPQQPDNGHILTVTEIATDETHELEV